MNQLLGAANSAGRVLEGVKSVSDRALAYQQALAGMADDVAGAQASLVYGAAAALALVATQPRSAAGARAPLLATLLAASAVEKLVFSGFLRSYVSIDALRACVTALRGAWAVLAAAVWMYVIWHFRDPANELHLARLAFERALADAHALSGVSPVRACGDEEGYRGRTAGGANARKGQGATGDDPTLQRLLEQNEDEWCWPDDEGADDPDYSLTDSEAGCSQCVRTRAYALRPTRARAKRRASGSAFDAQGRGAKEALEELVGTLCCDSTPAEDTVDETDTVSNGHTPNELSDDAVSQPVSGSERSLEWLRGSPRW